MSTDIVETTLHESTLKLLHDYLNIRFDKFTITCPYYINTQKKRKGDLRSLIGKGLPLEINTEYLIWSKLKNFVPQDENDLEKFLINLGIGIDCSGFVSQLLLVEAKSKSKKLSDVIKFSNLTFWRSIVNRIRFVENLDVELITDESNAINIMSLNEIKAGDLLKVCALINNGLHIAIVTRTYYEKSTKVIEYAHSDSMYSPSGVRIGLIKITNTNSDFLSDQEWIDFDKNKINYLKQRYEKDKNLAGFKRLIRL